MYLPIPSSSRINRRGKKTARKRAGHKAKQRRRVNGMQKRKLSRRLKRNG